MLAYNNNNYKDNATIALPKIMEQFCIANIIEILLKNIIYNVLILGISTTNLITWKYKLFFILGVIH